MAGCNVAALRGISAGMRFRVFVAAAVLCVTGIAGAQPPAAVDTSKIGPPIGARVPAISGVDQSGTTRTLRSISGPKGAMVVFFRSASW